MSTTIRFSSLLLAGLCMFALVSPVSAQLLQHKDISAAMAITIAETTIATCKANGYAVSATVVGRDRKSTRLNSSHIQKSRMPSSA